MKITTQVTDRRYSLDTRMLSRLVGNVLRGESASRKFVDIIYCRDRQIERLNKRFKGIGRSTDVLAFGMKDQFEPDFLGEVYVNLQMARRQAELYSAPYLEEVKRLTVHGVLHLLGYCDDTKLARSRLWKRQEGYLHNGEER